MMESTAKRSLFLVLIALYLGLFGLVECGHFIWTLAHPSPEAASGSADLRVGLVVGGALRAAILGVVPLACAIGLWRMKLKARSFSLAYLPIAFLAYGPTRAKAFVRGFERGVGNADHSTPVFVAFLILIFLWYLALFVKLLRLKMESHVLGDLDSAQPTDQDRLAGNGPASGLS